MRRCVILSASAATVTTAATAVTVTAIATIATVAAVVCTTDAKGAERVDLGRDWKFFTQEVANSDNAPLVNLPHMWSGDALSGRADYYRGMGSYLRQFDVPSSWKDKRLWLKFYGANLVADLFVNGRYAGRHEGGYTAFAIEITSLVRQGRNHLMASVNNGVDFGVLPTSGDMNCYGGLLRGVELIVANGKTAISPNPYGAGGVRVVQNNVSEERVEGEVQVSVVADREKSITAQLTICTPTDTTLTQSVKVKVAASSTIKLPFAIAKPRLWNGTANPFMYNVGVKLIEDGVVCDSAAVATGFRTIRYDGEHGLMLNGKPCPVRGVRIRQERAVVGPAISEADVRDDFAAIVEMGANAVRVVGVPHHPLFYTLCDQAGIIVWSDIPLMGGNSIMDRGFIASQPFMNNGREQLREIVAQQFNHPSVVMWGIFSDLSLRGDNPLDYLHELNALAKKEDPSRLTVAGSNQDGEINFITDLIVWNQHLGWREGSPEDISLWLAQLGHGWRNLASGIGYGAGGSPIQQESNPAQPLYTSNWHPEQWQTHLHEVYFRALRGSFLWGSFVDLFEYGSVGYVGGATHGVNDMGLITFDRRIRKDAYYFYKANWNPSVPFVYIAERRNALRSGSVQKIKAYTGQPTAELFVNGASVGVAQADHGIVVWPDVTLRRGPNTIEVRGENVSDAITVNIR